MLFVSSFALKIQGYYSCNNYKSLQKCYMKSKNLKYLLQNQQICFFSYKQLQHFISQSTSVSLSVKVMILAYELWISACKIKK